LTALCEQQAAPRPRPSNGLWGPQLRVRLRQRVLDREIAAGLRIDDDAARALRARQLTGSTERRQIAACLANILEAADERHADPASALKVNHAEILAARHDIVALIGALRGERVVAARGVALAEILIRDNRSPLLRCGTGRAVDQAVSEALAAL
jgi:hypothetical protein